MSGSATAYGEPPPEEQTADGEQMGAALGDAAGLSGVLPGGSSRTSAG